MYHAERMTLKMLHIISPVIKGMENLERLNLISKIIKAAEKGIPILGICLGMQL